MMLHIIVVCRVSCTVVQSNIIDINLYYINYASKWNMVSRNAFVNSKMTKQIKTVVSEYESRTTDDFKGIIVSSIRFE